MAGLQLGAWQDAIDVRDFIQRNDTPYTGDAGFLAGPTARTTHIWDVLSAMFPRERAKGAHDVAPSTPAGITAHAPGVHTTIDTSGFLGTHASDALLDDVDLVLLDIKSGLPETYRRTTGRDLAPTLDFSRRLAARGNAMWIRFVLVRG